MPRLGGINFGLGGRAFRGATRAALDLFGAVATFACEEGMPYT